MKELTRQDLFDRIEELQQRLNKKCMVEDRYEELYLRARRVLRYNGVNDELFIASLKDMDSLIVRHQIEMQEEEEN